MVMAIAAAAEDAGMAIDLNLEDIEADRDLATVIGQLDKLSKNAKFKDFLSEEMFPEAEEAVEERAETDEEEADDKEMDMDFARRM